MPPFLADPPQILYLVLGGLLVVTGAIAAQKQDRRAAIPFGVAALLMLLLFLIDRFSESPREEAVRRVYMMQMAADAKNPDALVAQVADRVTIAAGNESGKTLTREELKNHAFWGTLKAANVHVAVWGFSRDDVKEIDGNTVEIGFLGKGEIPGGQQIPVYLRATFTKQADGSRKLTALRTFDPIDHSKAFPIPMFP
jgi:hypothetical protein